MWERTRQEQEENVIEKEIDPLHLLPVEDESDTSKTYRGPLDPATVVAVAKRAYESLADNGDAVLSNLPARPREPSFESPSCEDAIMLEADGDHINDVELENSIELEPSPLYVSNGSCTDPLSPLQDGDKSTLVSLTFNLDAAARKKRIVEWLCRNIHHLNELSQLPFNSSELWRLHQHFFTPTVYDSGIAGLSISESQELSSSCNFSEPPGSSIVSEPFDTTPSMASTDVPIMRASEPVMNPSVLPLLKRKVSYRFLHEACLTSEPPCTVIPRLKTVGDASVSKLIEDMNVHTMQPSSKRPRRNRSRVSFVPAIKTKLDSFLDSCHQKALVLMRQLYYVEKCMLNNEIYPIEDVGSRKHLAGILAADAEMILLEMM